MLAGQQAPRTNSRQNQFAPEPIRARTNSRSSSQHASGDKQCAVYSSSGCTVAISMMHGAMVFKVRFHGGEAVSKRNRLPKISWSDHLVTGD
jgi:hypothetical protein